MPDLRSDALSLTLPVASKSRAKRRRRKLPPNWKMLVAILAFDVHIILIAALTVPTGFLHWSFGLTALAAAVDAQSNVRMILTDGRMTPELRQRHIRVVLPLMLLGVVFSVGKFVAS